MMLCKNINVLHVDGSAGLAVGLVLFALAEWVSELYRLPLNIILFLASANILYGCYALAPVSYTHLTLPTIYSV